MAKPKKRRVINLEGTATIKSKVIVLVRITDSKYRVEVLSEDIRFKRVWFEPPADDTGWMKLLYSADGPTGDPWPIGKVRVFLDADALDKNFGDFSGLTIDEAKE